MEKWKKMGEKWKKWGKMEKMGKNEWKMKKNQGEDQDQGLEERENFEKSYNIFFQRVGNLPFPIFSLETILSLRYSPLHSENTSHSNVT